MEEPKLFCGNIYLDDRGILSFVNNFDFSDKGIKRFYMVENFSKGFIRAWHGHRKEGKYVLVVSGTIKLGIMNIETKQLKSIYTLSSREPKILYIPPGYSHGFKTLEKGTKIIFFSTSTLEESRGDDIRFPWNEQNIWDEDYR